MMRVSNVDLHWQQNLPVSRLHASLSARQQDVADLKADRHCRVISIGEDGNLVGACEVPCCHVVRAKGCSTEDVGPESNFVHAGGTRLCQLERCVGSQCQRLFVPKVVPQKTLVPKAILSMQVVPDCVNSNAVLAVSAKGCSCQRLFHRRRWSRKQFCPCRWYPTVSTRTLCWQSVRRHSRHRCP